MAQGNFLLASCCSVMGPPGFSRFARAPFLFLRIFSLSLGFQLSIGSSTPHSIHATIALNPEGSRSRLGLGGLGPRSPS